MKVCLLDTDTLSELLKGKNLNVAEGAKTYLANIGSLTTTSITIYEIVYGLLAKEANAQAAKFEELAGQLNEIVPDGSDYRLAAKVRAALHRSGKPIGNSDPIIAVCAINRGYQLVTGNLRHYDYVVQAGFDLLVTTWHSADEA